MTLLKAMRAGISVNNSFVCLMGPPPPQYIMHPPVTELVPLHSQSLCKIYGTCVGGANDMTR